MQHGRTLLAAFLANEGLSQADLSRGTDIGTSLISNYLSDPSAAGHRDPGLAHAFAIEEWTKGAVPAKAWVGKTRKRRARRAA